MKRLAVFLLSLLMSVVMAIPSMAYDGTNYYDNSYEYYSNNYYMSDWTAELQDLYGTVWYESPQRFAERSEVFLIGWRAINNSLTRQRFTTLSTNYQQTPFTDLASVIPSAQTYIKSLYAMNILQGYREPDGTLTARLGNLITRAEMAAVYVRFNTMSLHMGNGYSSDAYMGYDSYYNDNPGYYSNYNFVDTMNHWAKQEISIAASNGILKGMGDGKYYPEENLTVEQLWAIMDRWVGYGGIEREDIAKALEQTFKVKCNNVSTSGTYSNYYSSSRVTSLKALSTSKTIKKGYTSTITFSVSPNISKLNYTCTKSDSSNAITIKDHWYSNGKISVQLYGNRLGTNIATITVRTLDGSNKTATTKISVSNTGSSSYYYDDYDEISSLTLSSSNVTLYTSGSNRSKKISVRAYPSDADPSNIYYESSNENVVYVDDVYENGQYSYVTLRATGSRTGSANIRVRTSDGSNISKTIYVTVRDNGYDDDDDYDYEDEISSLTLSTSNVTLYTSGSNRSKEISVRAYPSGADPSNIYYESSDESLVYVDNVYENGQYSYATLRATGNRTGSANIRVRTSDGSNISKTIYVTVRNNGYDDDDYYDDEISSLTLSTSNVTLYTSGSNRSKEISVRAYPSSADPSNIYYESTDESLVYVDDVYENGQYSYVTLRATGSRTGSANIRVRTSDGSNISKTIYVTVRDNGYDDDDEEQSSDAPIVTLEGAQKTYVGQQVELTVKVKGNYTSFNVTPDMVFLASNALSMVSCESSGNGVYIVTLLAVEPASAGICIRSGAAYNGLVPSGETNGVDVIVFENETEMNEHNVG